MLMTPFASLRWFFVSLIVAVPACRKEASEPVQSIPGQNVLLITIDTIRADRIGCYGHKAARTPALDAIAARGALFEDALTQVPLTLPSHCTIMTGRYPREFGVRINNQGALGTSHPTLASMFKEKGYKTGAFVSAFVLDSRFGLDRGFDVYDDQLSNVSLATAPQHWERPANAATDRALAWLDGNKQSPFYCWVHFFDPHGPYNPPGGFPQTYDGEIAFMDTQIKRLDDWLTRSGLRDRTLLIVVGDHGESFGEHGEEGHGMFLYETSMRVPFVISHPGLITRSARIAESVGVIDLFPTIVELMGWTAPPGLASVSLAPALHSGTAPNRDIYGESEYVWHSYGWAQQRSLTNRDWKFISSTKPELYDRKTDPLEKNNLFAQRPDLRVELSNKLFQQYEAMIPSAAGKVAPSAAATAALTTLGYTSGSASVIDEFLTQNSEDPKDKLEVIKNYKSARELLEHGQPNEAVALLRQVVSQAQQSPSLLGALGVALVLAGQFEEATTILDKALKLNPTHQPALYSSGEAYYKLGNFDKAGQFFTAAVENDPLDPMARFMLGRTLVALRKPDEAKVQLAKAVEIVPEFPEAHQELAILLAESKDVDGAIAHYRAALRGAPDNAQGWYNLGLAQISAGRHDDASKSFVESVRLNPRNGQAWINLGISQLQTGNVVEGKKSLQQATAFPETAAGAYYNLAITASREKDTRSAETYLRKVIEVAPTHPTAAWDLARDYLKADRVADALAVLQAAEKANPTNLRVLNLLASILATTTDDSIRNGAEALRIARAAADQTQSRNPFVLKTLAEAQAETGDFQSAATTAYQALQIAPPDKYEALRMELQSSLTEYESRRPIRRARFE